MSEIPKQSNTKILENPSSDRSEEKPHPHEDKRKSLTRLIADTNNPELLAVYEKDLVETYHVFQENKRLREELEAQRKIIEEQTRVIEEQKELIHELSYDSVTDLKIRTLFYRRLNAIVREHMSEALGGDVSQLEDMSMDEFTEAMLSIDTTKLAEVPLNVLMSDAAYLSLANKHSHKLGDGLLKDIGGAGKKIAEMFPSIAEFFRYGGDEIGGILLTENKMMTQHIAEKFEAEVATIDFAFLRTFGIEPKLHIDIGTSDLSEGVSAFQTFLADIRNNNENLAPGGLLLTIPPGERLKTFVGFWIGISDERATLHKAERRIPTLKFYREHQPEVYKNIISTMRKGALDATDEELDLLNNEPRSIREFIVDKRTGAKEEDDDRPKKDPMTEKRDSIADDIIRKTAASTFLDQ